MTTGRKKIAARPRSREFNIAGSIIPEEHYHVDLRPTLKKLMHLVDKRKYFVINRPRQFGKTTVLNFLAKHLLKSKTYLPIQISFEGYGEKPDLSMEAFYQIFWQKILRYLNAVGMPLAWAPQEERVEIGAFQFQENIRAFCEAVLPKKSVLLVDEVDSIPRTAVISFLRALREMYLERTRMPAFHAVALAGVHDIKNLKAQYRDETQAIGSASPFNIAIDYELPAFSRKNIRQYYSLHTEATGQEFDDEVLDRVYEVTNGHPWLVSVLAKLLVEKIVPKRKQRIRPAHTESAIQDLLNSTNSNFDSLFKNARNPNLFPIVLDLLEGKQRRYNIQNDAIRLGVKYGIFAVKDRQLILANLIYTQALFKLFEGELEGFGIEELVASLRFEERNNDVDFRRVLDKSQVKTSKLQRNLKRQPP